MTIVAKKSHLNENQLIVISDLLVERIEDIFSLFNIELVRSKKMWYGPCPVHYGDKYNAFDFYDSGRWVCRTHGCHRHFKGVTGLIRGLLSRAKFDWMDVGDDEVSFGETIKWISNFLGQDLNTIQTNDDILEKRKFAANTAILQKYGKKGDITRQKIRKDLQIPAQYYIDRGYTKEILDKYDVGLCQDKNKEMKNRVVVPIYDDEMKFLGCTGRTIYEKCNKCGMYHYGDKYCPDKRYAAYFSKWRHNKGFYINNYLYNYWYAKEYITKSGIAILVESPGNVWRLEENNIHNSVAIFGTSLEIWAKTAT